VRYIVTPHVRFYMQRATCYDTVVRERERGRRVGGQFIAVKTN
jgi:hypothetical protein